MIKKISTITAMVLFVSSAAFAAGNINIGTTLLTSAGTGKSLYGAKVAPATNASPLIGKTSTGVGVGVFSTTQGYSVTTMHMNGTKQFATSYDSTALYSKDVTTKGTPILGTLTAITTTDFSTWSAM